MEFVTSRSLDEAIERLHEGGDEALVHAGGTAIGLLLRQGLIAPSRLVSIARVDALRGVAEHGSGLRVGALTTLHDVARDARVRQRFPSLAEACSRVGNIRVRQIATLGGNLCEADYASDPPTVLVNVGAVCVVQGPGGSRRIPVAELVAGYYTTTLERGEILTAVDIPFLAPSAATSYVKYLSRSSEDRACVNVAARVDLEDERVRELDVVVGAVSANPQRVAAVCAEAAGRPADGALAEDVGRRYADAIDPIEDGRGSAWYRRRMIAVHVRRALEACMARRGSP